MTHHFHFRARRIDPELLDDLAERRGYDSRSEYLRELIRRDAREQGVDVTRTGEGDA
jgi:metal-responsive CopG/Arc/MetJ family transcriptional regulator